MTERTMQTTALLYHPDAIPISGNRKSIPRVPNSIRFAKYYHTNGDAVSRNSRDTILHKVKDQAYYKSGIMPPNTNGEYGKLGQEGVDRGNKSKTQDILPAPRTKEEAKEVYDRFSKFYDRTFGLLGGRKSSEMALEHLSVVEGETVLEIGFGTGHCLRRIAKLVGQAGKVYGIDISPEMIEKTKKRLEKERLANRAELCCGDATCLPFDESAFDAVFMSFVLEVFDTSEIPRVLAQIKKVLKPGGRLGIVAMSKENGRSVFVKAYEWIHNKCPKYLGSRPIYAEQCLIDAGYEVKSKKKIKIFRLPAEIIVAIKAMAGNAV